MTIDLSFISLILFALIRFSALSLYLPSLWKDFCAKHHCANPLNSLPAVLSGFGWPCSFLNFFNSENLFCQYVYKGYKSKSRLSRRSLISWDN